MIAKIPFESIGYLDEIKGADNLGRIVQWLPFHLRTKFVEVVDKSRKLVKERTLVTLQNLSRSRQELQIPNVLVA